MKKSIFFFISLLSLIFLGSCTSTTEITLNKKREQIDAFFLVKDTLYAIGHLHSYKFDIKTSTYAGPELIRFLQDNVKYAKSANITYIKKNVDNNKIDVHLNIQLDPKELSEVYKKKVEKEYSRHFSATNYSFGFGVGNGSIVTLSNKEEILSKGKLAKPLTTEFIEYRTSTHINSLATQVAIGAVVLAPIWIPLAIITYPLSLLD